MIFTDYRCLKRGNTRNFNIDDYDSCTLLNYMFFHSILIILLFHILVMPVHCLHEVVGLGLDNNTMVLDEMNTYMKPYTRSFVRYLKREPN
jgi:hypothetical protein